MRGKNAFIVFALIGLLALAGCASQPTPRGDGGATAPPSDKGSSGGSGTGNGSGNGATPPAQARVTNFEECAAAGNPVMESYPRQCRDATGRLFVEDVGVPVGKGWPPEGPLPPEGGEEEPGSLCIDQCGDGACQEIVCMGSGCPCPETKFNCPADCGEATPADYPHNDAEAGWPPAPEGGETGGGSGGRVGFAVSEESRACVTDSDCVLVNVNVGFGCCGGGEECEPIDYTLDKWIAVNGKWFSDAFMETCSEIQGTRDCRPLSPCDPILVNNQDYQAKCIKKTCQKSMVISQANANFDCSTQGCPEGYVCDYSYYGGQGPNGPVVKALGGDLACHRLCESDADCGVNAPRCGTLEITGGDTVLAHRACVSG